MSKLWEIRKFLRRARSSMPSPVTVLYGLVWYVLYLICKRYKIAYENNDPKGIHLLIK